MPPAAYGAGVPGYPAPPGTYPSAPAAYGAGAYAPSPATIPPAPIAYSPEAAAAATAAEMAAMRGMTRPPLPPIAHYINHPQPGELPQGRAGFAPPPVAQPMPALTAPYIGTPGIATLATAAAGGIIVMLVTSILWGVLTAVTSTSFGYVGVLIGLAIGTVVARLGRRPGLVLGAMAALICAVSAVVASVTVGVLQMTSAGAPLPAAIAIATSPSGLGVLLQEVVVNVSIIGYVFGIVLAFLQGAGMRQRRRR